LAQLKLKKGGDSKERGRKTRLREARLTRGAKKKAFLSPPPPPHGEQTGNGKKQPLDPNEKHRCTRNPQNILPEKKEHTQAGAIRREKDQTDRNRRQKRTKATIEQRETAGKALSALVFRPLGKERTAKNTGRTRDATQTGETEPKET